MSQSVRPRQAFQAYYNKHSSLVLKLVNYGRSKYITLTPGVNVTKLFSSSPVTRPNNLERLSSVRPVANPGGELGCSTWVGSNLTALSFTKDKRSGLFGLVTGDEEKSLFEKKPDIDA